jgi:hypothetical protein
MSEKPIFPDCAFPFDCQCAVRGYGQERESCAVPNVAAAAAALGLDPVDLFHEQARKGEPVRTGPRIAHEALMGSVTLIGNLFGDLAADLRAALRAAGAWDGGVILSLDELRRIHRQESIAAGLQAEAGVGSGSVTMILHYREEPLASGEKSRCWLTVRNLPKGDAVFWMVATGRADSVAVYCATWRDAEALLSLLRAAGGGSAGPIVNRPTAAPSDAELRAAEDY